jgi:hypothetical protein
MIAAAGLVADLSKMEVYSLLAAIQQFGYFLGATALRQEANSLGLALAQV